MQPVYVAFGGHEVAVSFSCRKVEDAFIRNFAALLRPDPTRVSAHLEVVRQGGAYRIVGDTRFEAFDASLGGTVKRLKYEVLAHLMDARPDLWWLHAGAAVWNGKAVVFAGAWGSGKSTLVNHLCKAGWTYLSDDVVPVDPRHGRAVPFPCTPAVRIPSSRLLPRHRVAMLRKTHPPLSVHALQSAPCPLHAVVFPTFTGVGPARLSACGPAAAALELVGHCMNRAGRTDAAIRFFCALFEDVPAYRLVYGDGQAAAALVADTLSPAAPGRRPST